MIDWREFLTPKFIVAFAAIGVFAWAYGAIEKQADKLIKKAEK
jgi:hypothetical protein